MRVFCFGDAVGAAVAGQKLPNGYYHLDRMMADVLRRGGQVGCCGTCLDARGLGEAGLVEGRTEARWTRSPTGPCGPTRSSASDRHHFDGH